MTINYRLFTIAILLLAAMASVALAASAGVFDLKRSVLLPGTEAASAYDYELNSAAGQPLVGRSEAGAYTVISGFLTESLTPKAGVSGAWQNYE